MQVAMLTQYGQFYVAISSRLMCEKGRKKKCEGRYVGRRTDVRVYVKIVGCMDAYTGK